MTDPYESLPHYVDPQVPAAPPPPVAPPTLMGYVDPNPQRVREEETALGAPAEEAPAPEVEEPTPPPAPKRERRGPLRRMRKVLAPMASESDHPVAPRAKPGPPISEFAAFNVGTEATPHAKDRIA